MSRVRSNEPVNASPSSSIFQRVSGLASPRRPQNGLGSEAGVLLKSASSSSTKVSSSSSSIEIENTFESRRQRKEASISSKTGQVYQKAKSLLTRRGSSSSNSSTVNNLLSYRRHSSGSLASIKMKRQKAADVSSVQLQ